MSMELADQRTETLLSSRNFWMLWLSMLISTSGTFILLLALSLNVYIETHSSLLSATVFGVQWLLPIFAAKKIGITATHREPKKNLFFAEILGALSSLAIGVIYGHSDIILIFVLLAFRGVFEAASKSFRSIAIKCYLPQNMLASGVAFVSSAQYLGGAVGAIIGTTLIGGHSILMISLADALSFIIAALLFVSLKKKNDWVKPAGVSSKVWSETFRFLSVNKTVRKNYLYLLLAAGIIQGWHNVARTTLPLQVLKLGHVGLIYIQVISSVSIFTGAILTGWYLKRKNKSKLVTNFPILIITFLFMLLSCVIHSPAYSLMMYAIFIFLFEVLYTLAQKEMIVTCPLNMLPYISSTSSTLQMTSVMVAVIIGGELTDQFGLLLSAVIFFVISIFLSLMIEKSS